MVQGARLLTADYAFRETVATRDRGTMTSVHANHGRRIDAALMMLIDLDRTLLAETAGEPPGRRFPFPDVFDRAGDTQQAIAMVVHNGELYQLVIVPVLAPLPVAWLAVGFRVDDALARDLRRLTRLQVSLLTHEKGQSWRTQASTLSEAERAVLSLQMEHARIADVDREHDALEGDEAITRVLDLSLRSDRSVVAVLQQPLAVALEPYWQLQRRLMLISLIGVVISIIASVAIARSIGRPVRELADVARRIAAGDYSTAPKRIHNDEIGDLAVAFRTMQEGILSRESRITDLAYRDALTGLPNRALFADRLDQALAFSTRAGAPLSVLLIDLDRFRYVNDTLGHPIGDLLLREVAARLQAVVQRATDTVARLGGDEFAILLPNVTVTDAQRAADAILRVLEAPMTLEGHVVDIHASIGLSSCPEHASESLKLLRCADVAMYETKRSNCGLAVWDDRYYQHSVERLSLMSDLRKAVDNDELALVYQPKVGLQTSVEHHVEALVRWQHPSRGLVPPSEFIPFAEQTGYIRVITRWVISHAVAQCAAWRSGGFAINVSINLSARDLCDVDLPEHLVALLRRERCAAQWISFEIKESAILDDPGRAIRNLERLAALGCRLAIDDYGTGYSSLAYLRRLPVHELKIDKLFVLGLAEDANNEIIVRSTIDLGHNMGLVVVAEGVEDASTLERLRALGCDMIQGFHVSRPLPVGEVERWARESTRLWALSSCREPRRVRSV